ncbi:MAG TPA: hypothetical protein VL198_15520 [Pseudolabrys sp.]|jgi:hypothetical protein|nr:hypothetical protein [Pseudolabrys sp.]
MLWIARKGWRRLVGQLAATFYLLTLAAPVTAVALSADSHCLKEVHALVSDHQSADHSDHHHSVPANQPSDQSQNCCGLFGVTAIAPAFVITDMPVVVAASITLAPSQNLLGRGFDRIDRPPRSLLSL